MEKLKSQNRIEMRNMASSGDCAKRVQVLRAPAGKRLTMPLCRGINRVSARSAHRRLRKFRRRGRVRRRGHVHEPQLRARPGQWRRGEGCIDRGRRRTAAMSIRSI